MSKRNQLLELLQLQNRIQNLMLELTESGNLYKDAYDRKNPPLMKEYPRVLSNDPLGIGPNKNNNPYLDKFKSDSNIAHKDDPKSRALADKAIDLFSKYGKLSDDALNDKFKELEHRHETDPIIRNMKLTATKKFRQNMPNGELADDKNIVKWERQNSQPKIPLR